MPGQQASQNGLKSSYNPGERVGSEIETNSGILLRMRFIVIILAIFIMILIIIVEPLIFTGSLLYMGESKELAVLYELLSLSNSSVFVLYR